MIGKILKSHLTLVSHLARVHLAAVLPSCATAITSSSQHDSYLMYI